MINIIFTDCCKEVVRQLSILSMEEVVEMSNRNVACTFTMKFIKVDKNA